MASQLDNLKRSVRGLEAQIRATQSAISRFAAGKGADGKIELVHPNYGDKFRMTLPELRSHLSMKKGQLKRIRAELKRAEKAAKITPERRRELEAELARFRNGR